MNFSMPDSFGFSSDNEWSACLLVYLYVSAEDVPICWSFILTADLNCYQYITSIKVWGIITDILHGIDCIGKDYTIQSAS